MQAYGDNNWLYHILKIEAGRPLAPASSSIDLAEATDEKLLAMIKAGTRSQQRNAFSVLYNRYYLDIWHFIKSKGLSETDAKDIFSDVWLIALEGLCDFEWQGKPIKAWLITTAKNKWLEFIRKTQTALPLEDVNTQALSFIDAALQLDEHLPSEVPSDPVREKADQLLHQALSKLDLKSRKIISLIYFKGKNSTEIGQILGLKPATVRQIHRRKLQTLRSLLQKEGDHEH